MTSHLHLYLMLLSFFVAINFACLFHPALLGTMLGSGISILHVPIMVSRHNSVKPFLLELPQLITSRTYINRYNLLFFEVQKNST